MGWRARFGSRIDFDVTTRETPAMTARPTTWTSALALIVSLACSPSAHAQAPATWTAAVPAPQARQVDVDILAGPLDFGGSTVKDAPYSAEAVTEVVQTLADGNRIVRSSSTAVYRDAAGRTRREQGLAVIGPVVASPDQQKHVTITDPEKGVTFVLDPSTRTARRMPVLRFNAGPAGGAVMATPALPPGDSGPPLPMPLPPPNGDVLFFQAIEAAPLPAAGAAIERRVIARRFGDGPAPVAEQLGSQTIEGVLVEGTRTTTSIPAGQIGNERPIEMVSERWFSPELKALVLSKQSDPRFGETTYRLSSIARGDPDPSLFEIPSDYTIVEAGSGAAGMFFRGRTP
jgi:hypothetical protein